MTAEVERSSTLATSGVLAPSNGDEVGVVIVEEESDPVKRIVVSVTDDDAVNEVVAAGPSGLGEGESVASTEAAVAFEMISPLVPRDVADSASTSGVVNRPTSPSESPTSRRTK